MQSALSIASNWFWVRVYELDEPVLPLLNHRRKELPYCVLHAFHHFRDRVSLRFRFRFLQPPGGADCVSLLV